MLGDAGGCSEMVVRVIDKCCGFLLSAVRWSAFPGCVIFGILEILEILEILCLIFGDSFGGWVQEDFGGCTGLNQQR